MTSQELNSRLLRRTELYWSGLSRGACSLVFHSVILGQIFTGYELIHVHKINSTAAATFNPSFLSLLDSFITGNQLFPCRPIRVKPSWVMSLLCPYAIFLTDSSLKMRPLTSGCPTVTLHMSFPSTLRTSSVFPLSYTCICFTQCFEAGTGLECGTFRECRL